MVAQKRHVEPVESAMEKVSPLEDKIGYEKPLVPQKITQVAMRKRSPRKQKPAVSTLVKNVIVPPIKNDSSSMPSSSSASLKSSSSIPLSSGHVLPADASHVQQCAQDADALERLRLLFYPQIKQEYMFVLCNGEYLQSIKELADYLDDISDSIFYYHVNDARNDFANWIRDVFGEKELALEVQECVTPSQMRAILYAYLVTQAGDILIGDHVY